MARLVGGVGFEPVARERRERLSGSYEMCGFGDDAHRLRPDAKQGFMGRPDPLTGAVALGGEQSGPDKGIDQGRPFRSTRFEAAPVECADHGRRLSRKRVRGDVSDETRDKLRQLLA